MTNQVVFKKTCGSGDSCDGQYLFACDLLGKNTGHVRRHARIYRQFAAEYQRLHAECVDAFKEFAADVESGFFPDETETVPIDEQHLKEFESWLDGAKAPTGASSPWMHQLGSFEGSMYGMGVSSKHLLRVRCTGAAARGLCSDLM